MARDRTIRPRAFRTDEERIAAQAHSEGEFAGHLSAWLRRAFKETRQLLVGFEGEKSLEASRAGRICKDLDGGWIYFRAFGSGTEAEHRFDLVRLLRAIAQLSRSIKYPQAKPSDIASEAIELGGLMVVAQGRKHFEDGFSRSQSRSKGGRNKKLSDAEKTGRRAIFEKHYDRTSPNKSQRQRLILTATSIQKSEGKRWSVDTIRKTLFPRGSE